MVTEQEIIIEDKQSIEDLAKHIEEGGIVI